MVNNIEKRKGKDGILHIIIPSIIVLLVIMIIPMPSSGMYARFDDIKGDDNGCGTIKYPQNKIYSQSGLFDILSFSVNGDSDIVEFSFNMANIIKDETNANGFDYLLLDSYMGFDGMVGLTHTIRKGAGIKFQKNMPWCYHVRLTPKGAYAEKYTKNGKRIVDTVFVKPRVTGTVVNVKFQKSFFNYADFRKAYYYVFSGGYSQNGFDGFMKVKRSPSQWNFSGGPENEFSPNIIDLVSPEQNNILSSDSSKGYVTLQPLQNNEMNYIVRKEYLFAIWGIAVLAGIAKLIFKHTDTSNKKEDL